MVPLRLELFRPMVLEMGSAYDEDLDSVGPGWRSGGIRARIPGLTGGRWQARVGPGRRRESCNGEPDGQVSLRDDDHSAVAVAQGSSIGCFQGKIPSCTVTMAPRRSSRVPGIYFRMKRRWKWPHSRPRWVVCAVDPEKANPVSRGGGAGWSTNGHGRVRFPRATGRFAVSLMRSRLQQLHGPSRRKRTRPACRKPPRQSHREVATPGGGW